MNSPNTECIRHRSNDGGGKIFTVIQRITNGHTRRCLQYIRLNYYNTYADVVDFIVKLFQIIRMLAQVVDDVRREKEMN